MAEGRTQGLGEAPQPFILQQVPLTPQCGFTPACPAAGLEHGAVPGKVLRGHGREGQTEGSVPENGPISLGKEEMPRGPGCFI